MPVIQIKHQRGVHTDKYGYSPAPICIEQMLLIVINTPFHTDTKDLFAANVFNVTRRG